MATGRAPGGEPWQVAIEDPAGGEAPLAVIGAGGLAVATSSIRIHRWLLDGRSVHHLLDPRTGEPAEGGLAAVSVAGPDPAWAEVWSKVLFLGGLSAIAGEARSRGLAAWWVAVDGTLAMTPAARALTTWVAAEARLARPPRERDLELARGGHPLARAGAGDRERGGHDGPPGGLGAGRDPPPDRPPARR